MNILQAINSFDKACKAAQCTPTDQVWDLLDAIRGQAKRDNLLLRRVAKALSNMEDYSSREAELFYENSYDARDDKESYRNWKDANERARDVIADLNLRIKEGK